MNEEFLKQLFIKLSMVDSELSKNYIPINNFKCVYDQKILPCFINFLRANKMKYLANPNKYYKIKKFLQKFLKDSEKRKLEATWAEEFSLEIDFFFDGKSSLIWKYKSLKLEMLNFFKVLRFDFVK